MKILSIIFLLLLPVFGVSQPKLDSLWSVWSDKSKTDTTRLKALYGFAWEKYLFTQPDSAIYFANKHFELASRKNLKKQMSNALNLKGVAMWVKSEYDSAHVVFLESLKLRDEISDLSGVATTYNNIGLLYNAQSKYQKALEYFEKSLILHQKINNKYGIANALGNIGIAYSEQGNYANAIKYYDKEIKIKESINDLLGVSNSLNNIGVIYYEQENYLKAIEYYNKSLKISKEKLNKKGVSLSYNNLGLCYQGLKNFDKAKSYFNKSLGLNIETGNLQGESRCYNNLGELSDELLEFDSAMYYFTKAQFINIKIGDERSIAITDINISSVNFSLNKFIEAIKFARNSLSIAKKNNLLKQIEQSSYLLYKSYKSINKFDKALTMYELFVSSQDSIQSDENQKEVIRQEYKYQYEKQAAADSVKSAEAAKVKDAQLSAEKAENKRNQIEAKQQRQQKYFLYGGLSLALLFGGFIFNRFRVTRKQKGVIEDQKKRVDVAYEQLGEKNQEILDSINYAKRIQSAILPPQKLVKEYLPDSFILYKPKDIVAGDFYWMEPQKDGVLFAAADCTGHGVPGAMVSVVCNNGLNRSVREYGLQEPAKILDKTREIVIAEFEKSEEEVKDGMDIALISLQKPAQSEFDRESDASTPLSARTHTQNSHATLSYAGAHNPLWIICSKERHPEVILSLSKGKEGGSGPIDEKLLSVFEEPNNNYVLIEIKADKQPIGKFGAEQPFTNHTVELQKGDSIYIFSDGYADQFGGEKGKKFKSKNFKKLLLSVQNETMERQRQIIDDAFERWKGDIEQLDDVCVIGVRL